MIPLICCFISVDCSIHFNFFVLAFNLSLKSILKSPSAIISEFGYNNYLDLIIGITQSIYEGLWIFLGGSV